MRPWGIIRALTAAGYRVTVAALSDPFARPSDIRALRAVCDAVHIVAHDGRRAAARALLALPTPVPLAAAFCYSSPMNALLRRLAASGAFDVAHIEHGRAAHFAPFLAPLPLVFDAVDCLTALHKQMMHVGSPSARLLAAEEWLKWRRYEPHICRRFAQIALTTETERAALLALTANLPPVTAIPNGVDGDYFHPAGTAPEPDTVLFSGKMSYAANDDAAHLLLREILPRLRRLRPNVRVIVAGSEPTAALRALAARAGNVLVTGHVEDMRPFFGRAALALCPMRIAAGIQNKILEAMAMACPVVCSPRAAREFAPAVAANAGIRVARSADEWATICAEMLSAPPATRAARGNAAREYVLRHHRWEDAAAQFGKLYEQCRRPL